MTTPGMETQAGIRIESVSLGKGYVSWRVLFPPMARRHRKVQKEYERLADACQAVKSYCQREQCAPETVELVEKNVPEGEWGSGVA